MHVGESLPPHPPPPQLLMSRSAREIIGDEMGMHAYKPVVDAEEDAATDATNGVSAGYRRARAG